jgi:8-oxo-dGTP diphosphatase
MGRADQKVIPSAYQAVPRTLCFVTHGDRVLLLRGAPDKRIWPNLFNGVGGHVDPHEDVLSAARREIVEETGIDVQDLRLCGVVNAEAEAGATAGILLFVFSATARSPIAHASEEGELSWVAATDVGKLDLVEDLPAILPRVLAMKPSDPPFFAHYSYDEEDRLRIAFADQEGRL